MPDTEKVAVDNRLAAVVHSADNLDTAGALSIVQSEDFADFGAACAPTARRNRKLDHRVGMRVGMRMRTGVVQSADSGGFEAACAPIARRKRKPDPHVDMSMRTGVRLSRLASMALTRIRSVAGTAEQDNSHPHKS